MTTREEVLSYVENNYQTKPEMTFKKFPTYCILRHKDNNKWYGLIMNVSKRKIGIASDEKIDILDVKVEPELIGALLQKEGYHPGYHMNKERWVSIDLNSISEFTEIKEMIDNSFKMTS
ncbi:MmcQ/YjbR family DNA-binding protein [Carnobacterium maltaromaticum]|uniref:MmcQ/YjbR family DNA-binding protein n=1 Tax=Carnobacterium maltaromaticum TaxID=2751 RepID=UPI0012FCE638|nr:MmcQ/YjbR family DNA-binding protein [Carnobacterium maltaromaticum]